MFNSECWNNRGSQLHNFYLFIYLESLNAANGHYFINGRHDGKNWEFDA